MNELYLSRREFISGAIASNTIVTHALAAPSAGSRLLIVFLRGAYDATNIIIPTGSDFYHEARPTIGLGMPDPKNIAAPLLLDSEWSLHPALRETIYPFWAKKQIAFVPFAGSDDLSRSHFKTQTTIELGQPVGGRRDYSSGFMARLAAVLGGKSRAIAFTEQMPLCFQGSVDAIPNLAIAKTEKPFDRRSTLLTESMYEGNGQLSRSVREGFEIRDVAYRLLEGKTHSSARGASTSRGFERSARRIGLMMRGGFNLAFVDVGGWDTHVAQGGATGVLATRIGDLGRGLTAFAKTIGCDEWNATTVLVISEFGRTFRENGAKGTDHGNGSIYWVMGGGVSGGRIAGKQVGICAETLNEQRDLPVFTDYRSMMGEIIKRQFGLSNSQVSKVFPRTKSLNLHLI